MPKSKLITAAELIARLENDPKHQQMAVEREKRRAEQKRILDDDERHLVEECNALGYSITSVWDFVNKNETYHAAFPILAKHLEMRHLPRIHEGIVRALSIPEAWGLVSPQPFIRLFREEVDSESELKWLLGSAIACTATLAESQEICDLMEDEGNGRARAFLPLALVHCPKAPALAILKPLVSHPVMGKSASKAISVLSKQ